MKKPTQREWVISQLKEYGEISRNNCLTQRITRLSAIIQDLEEENYVFEPKWRGGDYVYVLQGRPVEPPNPRLEASRLMEKQLAIYD